MARRFTFAFSALLLGQLAMGSCAGPKFSTSGACEGDSCDAGSSGTEEQAGRDGTGAGGERVGGAGGGAVGGKGGSAGRGGAAGASSEGRGGSGESGSGTGGAGGAATGGVAAGGMGDAGAGMPAGASGATTAGTAGSENGGAGGMASTGFPLTGVLDDFEDPGVFEDEWFGSVQNFTAANGVLTCSDCSHAALQSERFDADQEAYATLAGFEPDVLEVNLILLAQNEICELIEVLYSPLEQELQVNTCYFGVWELHGSVQATLDVGDTLGARLHADGTVQVFVNGEERLSAALGELANDEGHIGVSGRTTEPIVFDDFGGGEWR